MLPALGEFAYTLIVLVEIAAGALFSMSGAVLIVVEWYPLMRGAGGRYGAALAIVGVALFLHGSIGFASLAI